MSIFDRTISKATSHGKTDLQRVDYLDGWRGLAILFVLIDHFFIFGDSTDFGRFGVDIFFVLSGFLMSKILFVKRTPLGTFYRRRISRVFPVFIIYVLLMCALSYLLKLTEEHENVLYTLTFMRAYFPIGQEMVNTGLPIEHIWSLNVEEHCYVILSIVTLVAVLRGREYLALFAIGGSSIIAFYYLSTQTDLPSASFERQSHVLLGHLMISAGYFLVRDKFAPYVMSWMPVAAFFAAMFCYTEMAHWTMSWAFTPFFLAFAVNHLDKVPDFVKSILCFAPIRLFGIWSYSIYLWQSPFYNYLARHDVPFELANVVGFIGASVVGVFSFYVIENPIRTYLNNNWGVKKEEAEVTKKWPEVERRKKNNPRKNKYRRVGDSIKVIDGKKTVLNNAVF